MGKIELWLGPAGCGKTGKALGLLRAEMARGWDSVRYLVPTVGHKRSIEQLLLDGAGHPGLLGDPITTFFNFAEEVAQRANLHGRKLSELQKHLLLKKLARETPVHYFERARRFPGFLLALGEIIDELKVHMVWPEELHTAAEMAGKRGAAEFALKLGELGLLYAGYQQRVRDDDLYDNEGIMWTSAVLLREQSALLPELRCLILDGFARLTPIQLEFIRLLAPRLQRTILLFDYEEHRSVSYHPVEDSLAALTRAEEAGEIVIERVMIAEMGGRGSHRAVEATISRESSIRVPMHRDTRDSMSRPDASGRFDSAGASLSRSTTLAQVCAELFRGRKQTFQLDDSLQLLVGATPTGEAELIARAVRALLRAGALPDGTPVQAGDIAILARNADAVQERLTRTFARFGLPMRNEPEALAHTPAGRVMLAALRLVRDGWKREDVLTLLKSGFLAIDPALAFQIDLAARTAYLRDGRATWLERWPNADTRDPLREALAPLAVLDDVYHRRSAPAGGLLEAVESMLQHFHLHALPPILPLPDEAPEQAARILLLDTAFTQVVRTFAELRNLAPLLGGFRHEEIVELISTALLRVKMPEPALDSDGIPVLSVQATGGQKFKVVFLCHLLQGAFPHHQRESAFLLDHEREEDLRDLHIVIDTRKHLEDDEQYWFLHALSSATHRLVLSYAQHDTDGALLEHSLFIDEVERLAPDLATTAQRTSFRDIIPPLRDAESGDEFLAGLALGLRNARTPKARDEITTAYTGSFQGYGQQLAALFRQSGLPAAQLAGTETRTALAARTHVYSASELQAYLDCPFLWFGSHCLNIGPVCEEFSALDRGQILHAVLEKVYRNHQPHDGAPVHLEQFSVEEIWPEVAAELRARLEAEPRFANRAAFLRDIEWESLSRLLQNFLKAEIERAGTRRTHPAFFERSFGSAGHAPLRLGAEGVPLRGVIDRIDLADDDFAQAVVVDYKSSARMTLTELVAGNVLQAPIYALALERLYHLRPLGVEFMGLKQAEAKGVYQQAAGALYASSKGMRSLPPPDWAAFLADNEARIVAAAQAITAGHIALAPVTKLCPTSCDYFPLCRGNRFALERMVRGT